MTPKRHERVREIFLEVVESPPKQREQVLARCCGDDSELKMEVERLLAHRDSQADIDFSLQSTMAVDSQEITKPLSQATTRITSEKHEVSDSSVSIGRHYDAGYIVSGRYRIVTLLGRGGMGEVYRAEDIEIGQTVALKFLSSRLGKSQAWLERFRKEVRTAREVTHANVCRVYDIGDSDGLPFISMEFVDGEDLAGLIRRIGRLPKEKANQIAHQICAGVQAAHSKGVLHRDLKPHNIMLDGRGQVRITDFGLAAYPDQIQGLEITAGTPAYMAPEQIQGHSVTERSDIYALGLVLYEVFTGQPAFRANSIAEFRRLHCEDEPQAPGELVADLDDSTQQVILRCLEKDPADRPASALEVAAAIPSDALSAALSAGITPSPELVAGAIVKDAARASRSVAVLGIAGALLIIFLLTGGGLPAKIARSFEAPAILAERCRQKLSELTPATATFDQAHGFCSSQRSFSQLVAAVGAESIDQPLSIPSEVPASFWYRQSDRRLEPGEFLNVLFKNGAVSMVDPPVTQGGMATVLVDNDGQLRAYYATPRVQVGSDGTPIPRYDSLLDWAGIDPRDLTEEAAPSPGPAFADDWRSWRTTLSTDTARSVVIHAAASGTPFFFAVTDSVSSTDVGLLDTAQKRGAFINQALLWLLVGMLIVTAPLARRNVRAGRADRVGAFRAAVAVFAVRLVIWLFVARHAASMPQEMVLFVTALAVALATALVSYILYLGLEPLVRRHRPHMLVGWARLTRFKLRDVTVGWHVLIGLALGLYLVNIKSLDFGVVRLFQLQERAPIVDSEVFDTFASTRAGIATILDTLLDAFLRAMLFSILIVGLQAMIKRPRIAVVLAAVLLCIIAIPRGAHPAVAWLTMGLMGVGVAVWVLIRFGFLAIVVALWTVRMLSAFPVSLDFGAWYGDASLLALLVIAGLMAYGFWATRPLTRAGVTMASGLAPE